MSLATDLQKTYKTYYFPHTHTSQQANNHALGGCMYIVNPSRVHSSYLSLSYSWLSKPDAGKSN